MNNPNQNPIISLPIPEIARQTAKQFAQEQSNLEKAKQVYLNTLAVLVANTYLQMLDIPTDLEASHSWNSVGRLFADVADLQLTGIGHLECRPIRIGAETCTIPPEVWDNRIGYLIIQIDTPCKEGKILGFIPSVTSSIVHIQQLQPLAAFLEQLQESKVVQLRQWLTGIYHSNWQNIAELSGDNIPALAFRSKRVRGVELDTPEKIRQIIEQIYTTQNQQLKITTNSDITEILVNLLQTTDDEEIRWTLAEILWTINPHHSMIQARRVLDLGMQIVNHAVALMVAILPKPDNTLAVLLRLYPLGTKPYLPPSIKLAGLYENGEAFLEVQARNQDDYIQLKFCTEFGERFRARVSFEDATITEHFTI